jgi:hypothetical protein
MLDNLSIIFQPVVIVKYTGQISLTIDNASFKSRLKKVFGVSNNGLEFYSWIPKSSLNSLSSFQPNRYYLIFSDATPDNPILFSRDTGFNTVNYKNCAVWSGQSGNVTVVGTNGGPSYYGCHDMDGNVSEWVDTIEDNLVKRVYRGGNWSTTSSLTFKDRVVVDPSFSSDKLGFRVCSDSLPDSRFVIVRDVNNAHSVSGYGGVNYEYFISKYEITNDEYVGFLNSTASYDDFNTYNPSMTSNARGGISRSGSYGSYSYATKANMGNKPVIFVNWYNAARYCNWLHNNKPNSRLQNLLSTEGGSYNLDGATDGIVPKDRNACYWIPSEDEWIKAGYYKGYGVNEGYWNYSTQNDSIPECVNSSSVGNGPYCAFNSDNVCSPTPTVTPTLTPTLL